MALAEVANIDNEDSNGSDDDDLSTNLLQKGHEEELKGAYCCSDQGSHCMNNEDEDNNKDIDTEEEKGNKSLQLF